MTESGDQFGGMDPGIRFAVRVLNAAGIHTHQSCQGGAGHAYAQPSVDFSVNEGASAAGFHALAVLQEYGLPVLEVCIVWSIKNGLPYERLWRVTFSRTMEDRADERPLFVVKAVPGAKGTSPNSELRRTLDGKALDAAAPAIPEERPMKAETT